MCDVSIEVEKIMDEFGIEVSMCEDVFKFVDVVYKNSGFVESKEKDKDCLIIEELVKSIGLESVESVRLLEKEYKSYIKNGFGFFEGEKRDCFKEIKKKFS